MGRLDFGSTHIGRQAGTFVIAEAGVNHDGDLNRALELVRVAAESGADAVKFQTFKATQLVNATAKKADYQIESTGESGGQLEMLANLELDEASHHALVKRCAELDILFMSSPFDAGSADFLERLGLPAFKIGSGELTNTPFLKHVARKGVPMILSTGMARMGDVEVALDAVEEMGHHDVAILHCVSAYPADPADANLRAMATLASFGYPVGYSDHTPGISVPIAAVALGATVIEKHFTLDRDLPGPDHRASLEPDEFAAMVHGIRVAELALGDGRKRPVPAELDTARAARKSLVAACDIPANAVLTAEMLAIKRPGTGIPPTMREFVIGRSTSTAIISGELLTLDKLV